MNIAILLAGGSSTRFNFNVPKQYCKIGARYIIEYSLLALTANAQIDKIILVNNHRHLDFLQPIAKKHNITDIVEGGPTRQLSVKNALTYASKFKVKNVLIHDSARPFLNQDLINKAFLAIQNHVASIPVIPICDSIRKINKLSNKTLDRNELFKVQTPQIFNFSKLLECHNKIIGQKYNDDSALMEACGHTVNIFEGLEDNFKLTNYHDLDRANKLISPKISYRVGNGFDVHKFSNPKEDTNITLGGIKIKHNKDIIAHSDGDVLIHALVDAMLGSIACGDIGDHFPPTENKYKNMSSEFFLNKAKEMLNKNNAEICNIDITIICEAPKLFNYKNNIKNNLACILKISSDKINVKATTTEKLGFLGREEGIAVTASIMVKKYEP